MFSKKEIMKKLCIFGMVFFSGVVSGCPKLSGASEILSNPQIHFLVVGDYHGTNEVPALFSDIICHAIAQNRNISVALEWPESAQDEINQFLQADGGTLSRQALFGALGLAQTDGRGSLAMFEMIEGIRKMRGAKTLIPVIPIQPQGPLQGSEYEKKMAAAIVSARENAKNDLTLVFVGGAHAMKKSHPLNPNVNPMATYLPPGEVLSINSSEYFGTAWNCQKSPGDGKLLCGERTLKTGKANSRGIVLGNDNHDPYDGRFSVGSVFSASRPAF